MVNHTGIRTGIDIIGSDWLSARVATIDSVPRILSVVRLAGTEIKSALLTGTGEVVLSVPDEAVIFKNVSLPHNSPGHTNKLTQFELKHMFLEDPEEFCVDIIQAGQLTRPLATVVRKERLEQIWNFVHSTEGRGISAEAFQARSIALGWGFLQFCTNDTERLVCLADFARNRVSLCFVIGKKILAPASFDRSQYDAESDSGLARIGDELKTIINFKLSEFADHGINITLAKLIICGGNLTEIKKLKVAARLKVSIEEPIFSRDMIDSSVLMSETLLSDYLVSLGLTVE